MNRRTFIGTSAAAIALPTFSQNTSKHFVFSVVSHPAEAQVPIFTAQMKKASKKCQKNRVFFDFSNHARAQVPIFTPKMKNFRFARPARLSTRKWDFRRRSRPRELAQRSQDDVSLNKLPQIVLAGIFAEMYTIFNNIMYSPPAQTHKAPFYADMVSYVIFIS